MGGPPLPDALAWGTLASLLLVVFLCAGDYGLSYDEPVQSAYGRLLLRYYESGFHDKSAFGYLNLAFYGGGFDMVAALLDRLFPTAPPYSVRHALGGVVGVVGLAATWRLGRRIGGPWAGLFALILLAVTPSWFGHMFINPKDIPLATAAALVLWALAAVQDRWPRPSAALVLGLGMALGLMLGTRIGALILGPVLAGAWLLRVAGHLRSRPGRLGWADTAQGTGRLLLALPPLVLVTVILWPWVAQDWGNLIEGLTVFSRFPFDALITFNGALVETTDLPRLYLPTMLAVRLPEILLLTAVAAGLWGAWTVVTRPRILLATRGAQGALVALAVLEPLAFAVLDRPVMYNGMRHFLFLLPPLAVAGGLALERAVRDPGPWRRGLGIATLAVGVALSVNRLVVLHPYQYVSYNLLTGGLPGAYERYEMDYWDTSFKELTARFVEALKARDLMPPPGRAWKVWVCGDSTAADAYFPSFLLSVDNEEEAEFALGTAQFYCPAPADPTREWARVERQGVPLSWVIDQRAFPPLADTVSRPLSPEHP
ncbi:glycosyltransferase family 39 protein [Pararhodospirillum oryzae]|uniref:Glycosyltransferase RgtA/B/C/D-like domain-containing protein n=1 Tax=Pararhodospirillum oryzae TaxID=478448 RepID=A0A512H5R2_9PROT|nr:glycosyltransferase family 39 protein [Pararhodospirillum oryzae]GEO80787.1 hypothetical protein ROR02_09180 [Pararhodospirillum oryzae]